MLKITSRNEKLNRRMAQKENTRHFYKIFGCFFVYFNKAKNFKFPNQSTMRNFFDQKKPFVVSKRQLLIWQWQRYCLNWQSKLLFQASFTKARTICFLTGRSRSVYRAFHLSRLKIRAYAATGYFVGLSKASW